VVLVSSRSRGSWRLEHSCLALPLVGEAHVLVLAHAALLRAAERGGGAAPRRLQLLAAAALDTLAARAREVLEGGAAAVADATADAAAGNDGDSDGDSGDGKCRDGGDCFGVSSGEGGEQRLPFRTAMLRRTMFLPDADNEFAEPALGGALAAAAFAAGRAAAGAGGGASAAQLAARLRASAAGVLAAASEADAAPMLDGVLGCEGPWLALDGVDDAPAVFAAARVAEALLGEA
jgi:hypothetical protein